MRSRSAVDGVRQVTRNFRPVHRRHCMLLKIADISQINSPNPDLKWQSDRQYDIGIDFAIFNNRISGTFDYFNKITTNLLFPSPPIQPAPPGSTIRWKNLDGEILNNGLEVSINRSIIKQEKISCDLSFNASFLKNNVSGLIAPVFTGLCFGPVEIIQNGLPMDTFYTRKFLGLDKSTRVFRLPG